jgi:large subunit ribosomal protein L10
MTETATAEVRAPRPEKVEAVARIAERLRGSDAVFVTELASLRTSLRPAGAEYAVYKNTLARFAVREVGLDGLEEMLVGPTALTFVSGDIAAAAKALRDVSKTNANLVLKGGALGEALLGADDIVALADLPSREELLARIAGAFQAPLTKTAGLLQALPRNFAYGLSALIDKQAA